LYARKITSSASRRYFHQLSGAPNGPPRVGVGETDDEGVVPGDAEFVWPLSGEEFPLGVGEDVAVADGDALGDADALGAGEGDGNGDALAFGEGDGDG